MLFIAYVHVVRHFSRFSNVIQEGFYLIVAEHSVVLELHLSFHNRDVLAFEQFPQIWVIEDDQRIATTRETIAVNHTKISKPGNSIVDLYNQLLIHMERDEVRREANH